MSNPIYKLISQDSRDLIAADLKKRRKRMSSSLFKQFAMDHSREENGVTVTPAGPNSDGTLPEFILARMGPMNQKYQKTLESYSKPYMRQLQLKTLPNKVADELMMKVFVNSILLGWNNVQNEDGTLIAFNAENAIALFKQLPDLYHELVSSAQDAALFRLEEVEVSAKN